MFNEMLNTMRSILKVKDVRREAPRGVSVETDINIPADCAFHMSRRRPVMIRLYFLSFSHMSYMRDNKSNLVLHTPYTVACVNPV